jgi:DNA-binding MarR family transcriptional regulator
MQPPDISPTQYAALSALLDGVARRPGAVARAVRRRPDSFAMILRPLRFRGLVERVQWSEQHEGRASSRRIGYRITAAGRRAWQETLQFYLYFAERFGATTGPRSSEMPDQVEPLPFPSGSRSGPDRLPNDAEFEAIIAAAVEPLRPLLRALQTGPLRLERLLSLDVAGVDLPACSVRVRIQSRLVALPTGDRLRPILAAAIGGRRSGPVFINCWGKVWTVKSAVDAFSRARDAAGVAREVKLRGRLGSRRRRELGESAP